MEVEWRGIVVGCWCCALADLLVVVFDTGRYWELGKKSMGAFWCI
jgi:hypothetical protein